MNTPNKQYYYNRLDEMDGDNKHSNLNELAVGDFVYVPRMRGSLTGFVKKLARVNVTIETTYGGWADQDVRLMDIQVKKDEILSFVKPKKLTTA